MSKLTDIKYRIDQLDGGAFQNFCDEYLACKGYKEMYSLGMKTGTDKTAKGNPDTYFKKENGQYVFVMYTTQKEKFLEKALEDLEKCFDSDKTGLSSDYIDEIIYCHTCGRLLPGDTQRLLNYCSDQNTQLSLIGLDELGNDVYFYYPRLAKDYFNISVDTGQITSTSEFKEIHDANKMSAPLNTEFILRAEELKAARDKLNIRDVLVISGPAGVGKTRLALKLCEDIAEENNYEILCIKSNGLEIFEDLTASIEVGKHYLVFVDDANELTGLRFVLDYLSQKNTGNKYVEKVIVTVRDYAREQVVQRILDYEKPEILKVGVFSDKEIAQLLETVFGITNRIYVERIVNIAEGNARLAMLAGKVAVETNDLKLIRDATDLYSQYYGKQLASITYSDTVVASAGIIAFFHALRLDALDRLQPIFDITNLTKDQFIVDIKQLHSLELVDIRHDMGVRMSDQSFSNYLIKYIFVEKKIIPLSEMIKESLFINREKTVSACNVLLMIFSDQNTQKFVEEQINIVWDELRPNEEDFSLFFKSFYRIRPTDTLVMMKDLIDKEPQVNIDVRSIPFKKSNSGARMSDDIISILTGYKDDTQLLPAAIELLLLYYQKRPDLFHQIYTSFETYFGVDKDSRRHSYYTQKAVVEQLCASIESNPSENNLLLFVRVAEEYLKTGFSRAEDGRKNNIIWYSMPLTNHATVLEYRDRLLRELFSIYVNEDCQNDIESLLLDYCDVHFNGEDNCIVQHDLELIIPFFDIFSPDKLYHCIIAEHIKKVASRVQFDCENHLKAFLENEKYRIYKTLSPDNEKIVEMEYHEYESWQKNRIHDLICNYDLQDWNYLFQVCAECVSTFDSKEQHLCQGISYAIDDVYGNLELYVDVIKGYINADTPYCVYPKKILQNLFSIVSVENVREIIETYDFSQKNTWMWYFYSQMPEEKITLSFAEEFLNYLKEVPPKNCKSPYRSIDDIEKYENVYNDFFVKVCETILSISEEPFVLSWYFEMMMNPYHTEAERIVSKYEKHLSLLEEIYLKYVEYSSNADFNGHFLKEIFQKDPNFVFKYLNAVLEKAHRFCYVHDEWDKRLSFIWENDEYISSIDMISDYVFEKTKDDALSYCSIVGDLLLHEKGNEAISMRQEEWIHKTIENHFFDHQRMIWLFRAIEEHSVERRMNALKLFLTLNNDYTLFEKIPLVSSSYGGWGSLIPPMQERVTFLEALLPLLSGANFLLHRKRIEQKIEILKSQIKEEEVRELIDSLG